MSQPFDLDAVAFEGQDDPPFTFTWAGDEYEMRSLAQMPWTDVREMTDGASAEDRLRILLGPDQYDRFKRKPCEAGRLKVLMDSYWAHHGISLGE